MNLFARGLTIAVVAIVGCGDDTPTVTAKEPQPLAKSVRLGWETFVLAPNQSFDVQVILTGFAAGVSHECRFEPTTIGTVAAMPGACRVTSGAIVVPGRLIVRVETLADTASIVIFARS